MKIEELKSSLIFWGNPKEDGISQIEEISSLSSLDIIVCEMRPYLLGLDLFYKIKRERKFYITDNMVGHLFFREKIEKVLLFYEKICKKGVLGMPGSLYIAQLARFHKVNIDIFKGEVLDEAKFKDKDAKSLDGDIFFESCDVISPKKEIVPWEIIL